VLEIRHGRVCAGHHVVWARQYMGIYQDFLGLRCKIVEILFPYLNSTAWMAETSPAVKALIDSGVPRQDP
jgi:hypothetical protein